MKVSIYPVKGLSGEVSIPGDKSISHRGIMLGSIASGTTRIENFLMSKDCLSTIQAFRQMGASIESIGSSTIVVHGCGLHGLRQPDGLIDAGNSGTTARLLTGLLSGQSFCSTLSGDSTLRKRPMDRVVEPIRQMGGIVTGESDGRFLPLTLHGGNLHGIEYHLPVASAQVKSAVILASLYAQGSSVIHQPALSRNHTEVMLQAFGAQLELQDLDITTYPNPTLEGQLVQVPGDISSAAFLMAAALLVPHSELTILNVGINPTRTGIIDALTDMGAAIDIESMGSSAGEPTGCLTISSSSLKAITLGGAIIPRLIDEIPVIALAATQADGTTIIRDAKELKVKESNRIDSIVTTLKKFGAQIEASDDGMIIEGPTPLTASEISSHMDHRIAMMAAVAGLIAQGETVIDGGEWVDISFPGFFSILKGLGR